MHDSHANILPDTSGIQHTLAATVHYFHYYPI